MLNTQHYTLHYTYLYIRQICLCSVVQNHRYTSPIHTLHTLHKKALYIMLCVCIYMCTATRINICLCSEILELPQKEK